MDGIEVKTQGLLQSLFLRFAHLFPPKIAAVLRVETPSEGFSEGFSEFLILGAINDVKL